MYNNMMDTIGFVSASDPEVGKAIAKGEKPKILPEHLEKINQGRHSFRRCSYCGYETTEDFVYCPKCGNRF